MCDCSHFSCCQNKTCYCPDILKEKINHKDTKETEANVNRKPGTQQSNETNRVQEV